MQVMKESFENLYEEVVQDIARNKYDEMEKEVTYEFVNPKFEEKLTDTISLEDELANLNSTLIRTGDVVYVAGEPITFKLSASRKSLIPYLGKIKITGKTKKKLLGMLLTGEGDRVFMHDKAFLKWTFQYDQMSIDYFMEDWKTNKGFFKINKTSLNNNKMLKYAKTYRMEQEDKLDPSAFPEIELQYLDRALDLLEELEVLAYKSDAVKDAIQQRSDINIAKVIDLERELEEAQL